MDAELKDILLGGAEAKRRLFAGEDFASSYGRSVMGRVRRRRAASATAVGGGTLVAVGAVAAGAYQLPRIGVAFAGASPSVVCTTATPDAVAASLPVVTDGALFAVVDGATGGLFFAGVVDGSPAAWNADGSRARFVDVGGGARLELPSGGYVMVHADPSRPTVEPSDPGSVTVTPVPDYTGQVPNLEVSRGAPDAVVLPNDFTGAVPAGWTVTKDGETLGKAELDGNVLVVDSQVEGTQRVDPSEGGDYRFALNGTDVILTVANDGEATLGIAVTIDPVTGAIIDATASPVVTCVTESPEASSSASPSEAPTASPSVSPTASAEAASSPFECGFTFDTEESGTESLRVHGSATTDAAIHDVFEEWYGDQAPTTEVGTDGSRAYHASLESDDLSGVQVTAADPASIRHDVLPSAVGMTFVAVKDRAVVGTIPTDTNGAPGLGVDGDGVGSPLEAFLWNFDGFTVCGASSLDDAEIYAVAGYGDDGSVAYAWTKLG